MNEEIKKIKVMCVVPLTVLSLSIMDRQHIFIFDELSEDTTVETTPKAAVQSTEATDGPETSLTDERGLPSPPVPVAKKRGRPPKAKNPGENKHI
jgi:hypothetical protein